MSESVGKKSVNLSTLNSIIETTTKSNAGAIYLNRQNSSNYSFKDYTKANIKSYRHENPILKSTASPNANVLTLNYDQNEQLPVNKKQKFKFKMKLCRENTSLIDYVPCICLWFLLIAISAIYFGLVWPRFVELFNSTLYWLIILIVKLYLMANLIVNFLLSMFRNPGRLPMPPSTKTEAVPHKNVMIVYIKSEPVELKWCTVITFLRYLSSNVNLMRALLY